MPPVSSPGLGAPDRSRPSPSPRRPPPGRRVPGALPPRSDAAADDAVRPRLGPARGRPARRGPARPAGVAERAGVPAVLVVLLGSMWHGLVYWLASNTGRARLRPAAAVRPRGRVGVAVHGRLASRTAAAAAPEAASGDGRPERRAVLRGGGVAAVRLARGGGAEGLHQHDVRQRPGQRGPRRPLQRAAARRGLWLGPLGPAPGQPDGGEHRRGHRPDGPVRAAAQHAELPVPHGLGDGRPVPATATTARAAS